MSGGIILLLTALAAALVLVYYFYEARLDAVRERLNAGVFDETPAQVSIWQDAADLLQLERLQAFLGRSPLARRFAANLRRAGLRIGLTRAMLSMVAASGIAAGAAGAAFGHFAAAMVALLLVPLVLWRILSWLSQRRVDRLEGQLPGLVVQMLSSLRSGATPLAALQAGARSAPRPLSSSLGDMLERIQLGISPGQAWREWALAWNSRFCDLLATGMRLKWEAGGEMSSMLEHILEALESRHRMKLRIGTLTAMARFSAYVLMALPFVIGLITYYVNPRLFDFMLQDAIGRQALWITGGVMLLGFVWLQRIARLES